MKKKISYEPFITQYTDEIINDIREYLKNHHFDTIAIDTLDICHLIGKIDNLQEEKQRLLESADCLSKGYNDLEKRIDKAVEYIKEKTIDDNGNELGYSDLIDYEVLLDILQGE